ECPPKDVAADLQRRVWQPAEEVPVTVVADPARREGIGPGAVLAAVADAELAQIGRVAGSEAVAVCELVAHQGHRAVFRIVMVPAPDFAPAGVLDDVLVVSLVDRACALLIVVALDGDHVNSVLGQTQPVVLAEVPGFVP